MGGRVLVFFGTTVAAQVLGHKDVKFPHPRSFTGRLLFLGAISMIKCHTSFALLRVFPLTLASTKQVCR